MSDTPASSRAQFISSQLDAMYSSTATEEVEKAIEEIIRQADLLYPAARLNEVTPADQVLELEKVKQTLHGLIEIVQYISYAWNGHTKTHPNTAVQDGLELVKAIERAQVAAEAAPEPNDSLHSLLKNSTPLCDAAFRALGFIDRESEHGRDTYAHLRKHVEAELKDRNQDNFIEARLKRALDQLNKPSKEGEEAQDLKDLSLLLTAINHEMVTAHRHSEEYKEAVKDLVGAVRSLNQGKSHEIMIPGDDEPCYWQRREWIQWILDLCNELEAKTN